MRYTFAKSPRSQELKKILVANGLEFDSTTSPVPDCRAIHRTEF